MKIVALANQKGGVGKTTSTLALADIFAIEDKKILLIDLDPQASLTESLDKVHLSADKNLFNLFSMPQSININTIEKNMVSYNAAIDIIPGHPALGSIERMAVRKHGMGLVLERIMTTVYGAYDYVLIDCAPSMNVLLVNALAVCNVLLVPAQTELLAFKALQNLMMTLQRVETSLQRHIAKVIVPTMYNKYADSSRKALAAMRNQYGTDVWHAYVPYDQSLRDAGFEKALPATYSPESLATTAYVALADYLDAMILTHTRKQA